ncbi:AAA family ATPase, partial [Gordonia bronchialis]|uniref:AAA family ATPase n=1 Tax=Gordonia bronchialis TaxID=2054 RepID=UPI002AB25185
HDTDLHTSRTILAAEARIVAAARRVDGRTIDGDAVSLALLEQAANGRELNDGQSAMVREMATSGRRVQLVLAPAGTGKTTALRTLARAWNDSGGTTVGLAPTAAAAAVLREELDTTTDTAAKTRPARCDRAATGSCGHPPVAHRHQSAAGAAGARRPRRAVAVAPAPPSPTGSPRSAPTPWWSSTRPVWPPPPTSIP